MRRSVLTVAIAAVTLPAYLLLPAPAVAMPPVPAGIRVAVQAADMKQTIWWEPAYGGYCPPSNGCYGLYGYPHRYGYHRQYFGFYQPYRRYWWGRSHQWSWW